MELGSDFQFGYLQDRQLGPVRRAAGGSLSRDELYLKLLLITIFLPEGLSFFVGDFRLSVARLMILFSCIVAITRLSQRLSTRQFVCVPSDILAPAAGTWMMLAATITDGLAGLKGAGIEAVEFVGAYLTFRFLLGSPDSAVRVLRFSCKLMILVVCVALLDPLYDKLFTYELVKGITGYAKPSYESALASRAEALFRDGVIRAMGPLEHSILFGAVCVWFGVLACSVFRSRLFGWSIAGIALIGVLFSQARSPLLGYVIGVALAIFYSATPGFTARWKLVGLSVTVVLVAIFSFSGSPVATLVRLSGVSAESGWYRQAIWDTAVPVVLGSPLFGIGLNGDWNWQSHGGLVSASVDSFWLSAALMYGIPGSTLVLLTIVSAFWFGPIDKSPHLTHEERRLSVALGLVTTTVVVLGFIVHFWGTCWILLAVFAGMRANLAEAAIIRHRAARAAETGRDWLTRGF
ncbi:O-antigen ligase family protein [Bradyrhizobium sp. 166]|uniref:O-antigen ligase family protein n=1 Tax=Bradyrhizobium sp. 166 TaxID=2782638 RepID=UPI001FFA178A|nr:O-antigen ligase family protein [Bradyrhizobium sp. 166]MCK1607125.1 O-antigen ligase family protein [Bradyrhizobium sp. 166]